MRKIFLNITVLYLVLMFASCKKDYLETAPTDAVGTGNAFLTTENAKIALNGIHRILYSQHYSTQSEGGQSANMIFSDMMGEDLVNTTTGNGWFIAEHRWQAHRNANSAMCYFEYAFYYEIIGNANQIIANIDNATGPDADKKLIKGNALFYRAWSYFQMIQLFGERFDATKPNDGLGVPLVLTPVVEIKPRNTVAEVYVQINKDIDDAMVLLSTSTNRPNKSYQDLKVAQGLKARIALVQQNWAVAADMANKARQGYAPMAASLLTAGFNDINNAEWMWGIAQQADQQTYFYSFYAYMGNFSSTNTRTNPKAINSTLYNSMSNTDERRKQWDPTGTNTSFPLAAGGVRKPYMSGKFLINPAGGGISIGDLPFMRAAEMYLLEAEAKARLGQDGSAAQVLYDLISKRDPGYTLSTNTGANLLNEIWKHRRIELWGEGFRFYDLKRLNLPLNRNGANHQVSVAVQMDVPVGDKMWQVLIPQSEINATNGVVLQNPL